MLCFGYRKFTNVESMIYLVESKRVAVGKDSYEIIAVLSPLEPHRWGTDYLLYFLFQKEAIFGCHLHLIFHNFVMIHNQFVALTHYQSFLVYHLHFLVCVQIKQCFFVIAAAQDREEGGKDRRGFDNWRDWDCDGRCEFIADWADLGGLFILIFCWKLHWL